MKLKNDSGIQEDRTGTVSELLPPSKSLILGFQHVLVMYSGAVAVPLMLGESVGLTLDEIGLLVCADLFTCGIATIFQTIGLTRFIGIRLPLMMGVTMVALKPMISIGKTLGMCHIFGAILVSALIVFIFSGFFSRLKRFFPPVVTGSIISVVGLSLIPLAMQWAGGEAGVKDWGSLQHLAVAGVVILVIISVTRFCKGFIKSCAVLIGMTAGSLISFFSGHMNLSNVSHKAFVAIPNPFWFGIPQFDAVAIISMLLVAIVCFVESTGVFMAMGKIVNIDVSGDDIARGLRAESLATIIGSLFNSFPYITFSQNLGLVIITGVKSRFVVATGGLILVILGLLPKLGAVIAAIPAEVLGGVSLVLFGMVSVAGIQMLSNANLECSENQFIVSLSIGVGLGASFSPGLFDSFPLMFRMIFSNGIIVTAVTAVILNIIFNYRKIEECDKEIESR